jgi:DnaK suppressor protein
MTRTIEHLTPTQLSELEDILNAERVRLERLLPPDGEDTQDAPEFDEESNGYAPPVIGPDSLSHETGRLQAQRAAIADALQRLREGMFGICSQCHGPIPFGRLVVLPESERCVGCGAGY